MLVGAKTFVFHTLEKDKKPLRTSEGDNIPLAFLIKEAQNTAYSTMFRRDTTKTTNDHEVLAKNIGIEAIKYFDLKNDYIRDYVFDIEQILSFQGNNSVYIQNAYTRISSILRKALQSNIYDVNIHDIPTLDLIIETEVENSLVLKILEFWDV